MGPGGPPLFKSLDGGLTWVASNSGLPDATVSHLVIDPIHPDVLYATTWLGVFRSTDGAATWSPLGPGLTSPAMDLALDPSGPVTLHTATFGSGVFELTEPSPP